MHVSCASHFLQLRPLLDDADHFNWCVVPDKSYDAVLFGAMAVLVAVLLQGKYSALWTLIAGMIPLAIWLVVLSLDTTSLLSLHACYRNLLQHRWCSPSISFTFQDWSTWQWHCNLAGHSACRPVPVHLPAPHACGRSCTYRLLHISQGIPHHTTLPHIATAIMVATGVTSMATVCGLCSLLVNSLCSLL